MTVKEQFAMMYITSKWKTTHFDDLDNEDQDVFCAYMAGFDKARSLDQKRVGELNKKLVPLEDDKPS